MGVSGRKVQPYSCVEMDAPSPFYHALSSEGGEGEKQHLAVPCAVPLKTNIMRQSIWGGIRPTWENHPSVFEEKIYLEECVNQSIDVWRMSYQEEKCALSSLLPSSSSREH